MASFHVAHNYKQSRGTNKTDKIVTFYIDFCQWVSSVLGNGDLTLTRKTSLSNYFPRFGRWLIKGFIMDLIPLSQLDQDLKFTAWTRVKSLMFPQYLLGSPIIPDIVIVNTLLHPSSSGLRRKAPPGNKRNLNWPENRQRNEISRITRKAWAKGEGSWGFRLDQKWSKPWLRLKCYHINNGTVSPGPGLASPEADGAVTTLPRDQNPIRDFGYCRALMINPEKRETSWPH